MQLAPLLIAWTFTSAMLVAEHIGLWQQPWRAEKPYTYIIGIATLLLGDLIWAAQIPQPIPATDAVIAFGITHTERHHRPWEEN